MLTKINETKVIQSLIAKVAPGEVESILRDLGLLQPTAKLSLAAKGHVSSVEKNVQGAKVAIHKLLDLGKTESIPPMVWNEVETILSTLSIDNYKAESQKTPYESRLGKIGRPKNIVAENSVTKRRGRPRKNSVEVANVVITPEVTNVTPEVKRRGRPKGSTNRPKVEGLIETAPAEVTFTTRRGRPKGSKNQPKVEASTPLEVTFTTRRGRPKGSKNQSKSESSIQSTPTTMSTSRRGRPKGSLNRPKSSLVAA